MSRCLLFVLIAALALTARAGEMVFWGAGLIGDARAVGIAPNGDIWVGSSDHLTVFSADGAFKRVDPRTPGQVNSILFDAAGDPVIGCNSGNVSWYAGEKARVIGSFGSYSPWEVALDAAGTLFATDGGNGAIKQYTKENVLLRTITAPAGEAMARPYSLALDGAGHLFVTDERKPGLWEFSTDGVFVKRLLPAQQCWRVRRGPDGIDVITDAGLTVLDAGTGEVVRKVAVPGGYQSAMGFAVDAAGNLYCGHFYEGVVRKYAPDGKLLLTIGPSFKATVTAPDAWTKGAETTLPLKVQTIATTPVGAAMPTFTASLQPAVLAGEPVSNYANAEGCESDPAWIVVSPVRAWISGS